MCPPTSMRGVLRAALLIAAALAVAAAVVTPAQAAVYSEGGPLTPFSLSDMDSALTVDSYGYLAMVTPVTGALPVTASAVSRKLDLGRPAMDKDFASLSWAFDLPTGTSLTVDYRVGSSRTWQSAGSSGWCDLSAAPHGYTVAYRVRLESSATDATLTPTLCSITVNYTEWKGDPTTTSDKDATGTRHSSSHTTGPGTYTYRAGSRASGTASTSGTTVATGASGGSGSDGGSRAGGGTGDGSGTSATASAAVPSPPASSTATGDGQSVSGLSVDSGQTVTGTVMRVSGGSASGGDGSSPQTAASPRGAGRYAAIGGGSAALAALLFGPWLVTAARLRRITGYDGRRARQYGPFGPLAR